MKMKIKKKNKKQILQHLEKKYQNYQTKQI